MIKLFNENHINDDFQETFRTAVKAVDNLSEYELTNQNSDQLAEKICKSLKEETLEVDLINKIAKVEMVEISGSSFPQEYDVNRNKNYPCARVKYTFDIKSESSKFLYSTPTNHNFDRVMADVDNLVKLHIFYQTRYGNIELNDEVKTDVKNWIINLIPKIENTISLINKEIEDFNTVMPIKLKEIIENRISKITKKNKQNDDLADF